jgi:hypothetical protein
MSKQITRRPTKQMRRQDRREEQRRREEERLRATKRRRTTIIGVIAIVAVLAVTLASYLIYANIHNAGSQSSTTSTTSNPAYPRVDGLITCDPSEQLAYHIHAHLTLYINGQPLTLPSQIGIAPDQSCLYWLHVHDTTGVIHIEAPANQANHIFSLGNFIDEWATVFPTLGYPSQLDLSGWTAYVNGTLYKGDFHKIPLQAHAIITLVYNSPNAVPDTTYNWNGL